MFQSLVGSDTSGGGATGLLTALVLSLALVSGIVAWVAGVILAARARSTLWLVVAMLPFFPINSMMCAMFCPATPPDARR